MEQQGLQWNRQQALQQAPGAAAASYPPHQFTVGLQAALIQLVRPWQAAGQRHRRARTAADEAGNLQACRQHSGARG